jgi:hypothetical protein
VTFLLEAMLAALLHSVSMLNCGGKGVLNRLTAKPQGTRRTNRFFFLSPPRDSRVGTLEDCFSRVRL